jgi:hypothetical protein
MHIEENSTRAAGALMSGFVLGGTVLVAGVLLFETFGPKESSIIARLYEKLGYAQTLHMEAKAEVEAEYEYQVRTAIEEVERLTYGCNKIHDGLQVVIQQAAQMEAELVQAKAKALSATNGGRNLMTGFTDFMCILGKAAETPETEGFCTASEQTRSSMMQEYNAYPAGGRPRFVDDMASSLPTCSDLLSPEFQRLRAAYVVGAGNEE